MTVWINKDCCWEAEEFWVPMDTSKENQCDREVKRKDRLLPIGRRRRGDVGVITE